jgi:DNA-binding Lrp family transcriptional regulator
MMTVEYGYNKNSAHTGLCEKKMTKNIHNDELLPLVRQLDDFPVVREPWKHIAKQCSCSIPEALNRVTKLREDEYFRHFHGLFSSGKLGYESTLIGCFVETDQLDSIAEKISNCPFVSHNFHRENPTLNLWFTLTCPKAGPTIDETLAELSGQTGLTLKRFDTLQHYKISFSSLFGVRNETEDMTPQKTLSTEKLIQLIIALQQELPLVEKPFEAIGRILDVSEDQVLDGIRWLKFRKILRRIGPVWKLDHFGIKQNVMCAWNTSESCIDSLASIISKHPRVSHCYHRTDYPDWNWNLYSVIHGESRQECERFINDISEEFGERNVLPLWTIKEYKQTPVRYDPEKIILSDFT